MGRGALILVVADDGLGAAEARQGPGPTLDLGQN
jgi:hypothetical protein